MKHRSRRQRNGATAAHSGPSAAPAQANLARKRRSPKWAFTQEVAPKDTDIGSISKKYTLAPEPDDPSRAKFDEEIKRGQETIKRADKDWKDVLDSFATQYGIFSPDKLNIGWLAGADLSSKFSDRFVRPSDTAVSMPDDMTVRYFPQHIESLLNQAADLLDRCVMAQLEWSDRAAKAAAISLEILDYIETDKIHQDEIAAGIYTVPFKQSFAEWKAYNASENALTSISTQLEWGSKNLWNIDQLQSQVFDSSRVAYLSGLAPYQTTPPLGPQQTYDYSLTWQRNVHVATQDTVANHFKWATVNQAEHAFRSEWNQVLIQQKNNAGDLKAATQRASGWGSRANWDQKDIDFRRRRTEAAKKLADLKVRMVTEPGGALNYADLMMAIQRRYERDFLDALGRIAVAAAGLHRLFDYTIPFPASLHNLLNKDHQDVLAKNKVSIATVATQNSALEEAVLWTRNAISWMISFAQLDQTYTRVFSIRKLVGGGWNQGLSNGEWNFKIDESILDECHARIRSISLFIIGQSSGLWSAQIKVPGSTNVRTMDGRLGPEFEQALPLCRLGRVTHRDPTMTADIGGSSSLHNASPMGEWQLHLGPTSTEDEPLSTITDIHLDLELTARIQ
jgi:hypothetical protein